MSPPPFHLARPLGFIAAPGRRSGRRPPRPRFHPSPNGWPHCGARLIEEEVWQPRPSSIPVRRLGLIAAARSFARCASTSDGSTPGRRLGLIGAAALATAMGDGLSVQPVRWLGLVAARWTPAWTAAPPPFPLCSTAGSHDGDPVRDDATMHREWSHASPTAGPYCGGSRPTG